MLNFWEVQIISKDTWWFILVNLSLVPIPQGRIFLVAILLTKIETKGLLNPMEQ